MDPKRKGALEFFERRLFVVRCVLNSPSLSLESVGKRLTRLSLCILSVLRVSVVMFLSAQSTTEAQSSHRLDRDLTLF